MNKQVFYNINKIIERDSKTTTYKFALLRGLVEIIQDNSPYIVQNQKSIEIPLGLMIEKWLIYYYPILKSEIYIPQINGNHNLAFAPLFQNLISYYENKGGFSVFYNDLKNKGIPLEIEKTFIQLLIKIKETITQMPMKYIGRSIHKDYYSIFSYKQAKNSKLFEYDLESIILNFGSFSIPLDYFEALKILGSFISGQDSILFKWAEFSVNASGKQISLDSVLNEVLKSPITDRNITESKNLYMDIMKENGKMHCVWTGKKLKKYDIDHLIPFSVWKNNDLWNLLPSDSKINNQKRDKIPTPDLIESQKEIILEYWELIFENQKSRFQKEFQITLLGNNPFDNWKNTGIQQLQKSCDYLINVRGYEAWKN